jgi:Rad3-related DNA helicase
MPYFKSIFGCEPTARERVFPSPFPAENLCVIISDRISTRYRHRAATAETATAALVRLVEQRTGNYFLFFPSYEYMKMLYTLFVRACPGIDTRIQTPDMTEDDRDGFLARFCEARTRSLVGFVVMGGIFGEGIDLVGERLSGAGIVGVGLPGISQEREVIRDYYDHHLQAGFEYAYLFPGMIRVLQAAGRVIRTENDKGAILLIGQRFATPTYRGLLPMEWEPDKADTHSDIERVLKAFWQ